MRSARATRSRRRPSPSRADSGRGEHHPVLDGAVRLRMPDHPVQLHLRAGGARRQHLRRRRDVGVHQPDHVRVLGDRDHLELELLPELVVPGAGAERRRRRRPLGCHGFPPARAWGMSPTTWSASGRRTRSTPGTSDTGKDGTGCRTAAAANPLQLDGSSTASFNSIVVNAFAIPSSYLLLCPTNSASC